MGLFMDVCESWDLMVVMLRIVAVPVALLTVIENPLVVVVVGCSIVIPFTPLLSTAPSGYFP